MAGPSATVKEVALKEVFMEQGVADISATFKQKAGFGLLPLKDAESSVMLSLDSQLSDMAKHPSYPFWEYWQILYDIPIMLHNTIPAREIPQRANYVAFNIEKHDGEPTVYSTMRGNALIFYNVLHMELRPDIATGMEEDDIYLLREHFQMDSAVTRAIEAIGDAGITVNIIRLRCFSKRKREVQQEW